MFKLVFYNIFDRQLLNILFGFVPLNLSDASKSETTVYTGWPKHFWKNPYITPYIFRANTYNPYIFWKKCSFEKKSVQTVHLRKIKPFLKKHTSKLNFSSSIFHSLSFMFMYEGLNFFSRCSHNIAFKSICKNYLHTYYIYIITSKLGW